VGDGEPLLTRLDLHLFACQALDGFDGQCRPFQGDFRVRIHDFDPYDGLAVIDHDDAQQQAGDRQARGQSAPPHPSPLIPTPKHHSLGRLRLGIPQNRLQLIGYC
jgi:hypothetical protein